MDGGPGDTNQSRFVTRTGNHPGIPLSQLSLSYFCDSLSAQRLDSPALGAGGRRFESARPD